MNADPHPSPLDEIRVALGMPPSKPDEHVVARVKEIVIERLEAQRRSTEYEERWAKLCDLLGVSYGAEPDVAFGDVRELQRGSTR